MTKRASSKRKEAPDAAPKKARGRLVTLEEGVRLSDSKLWGLQRRFFVEQDPRAWGKGRVPSYVTSNAFIARATARVIGGFLDDAAAGRMGPVDASLPVDIVELGSGSGRFAYGVLRELEGRAAGASRGGLRARLIVTDLHEAPVRALRENPRLARFVKRGLLDFAVFDAEAPGDIVLLESRDVLRVGASRNPVCVLANYVFDGIRMDAFEVRDGQLHEARVRVQYPSGLDPEAPATLPEMRVSYERHPAAARIYQEEELEMLLRRSTERLPEGSLLFPVSALRVIRHFRALGGGRALVLAADRGHVHEEALLGLGPPQMMRHGSVSFDVNFHVLAEHARGSGGVALVPAHHPTHLATVGLLWGAPAAGRSAEAYEDHLGAGGPEDIYLLNEALEKAAGLDTAQGLAWLRTSAWDPEIFLLCAPSFLADAETADHTVRLDILDAARRVREAYFPVGGDLDIHLALGETFHAVDALPEAMRMFEASMAIHGRNAATLHRLAMCASGLHHALEALAFSEEALALDPGNEDARAMRIALQADLRRRP